MAIKLRVLHYPDTPKLSALCKEISSAYDNSKYDKIPPAYPCENEKLLIAVIKTGKEMTSELKNFVNDLTKSRAQNVQFFFGCSEATGKQIEELALAAGTKLVAKSRYIKFPILPFLDFNSETKEKIKGYVASAYEKAQENG